MSSSPDPFDFSDYTSPRREASGQWPTGSPAADPLFNPFGGEPVAATDFARTGTTDTAVDSFGTAPARSITVSAQGSPPLHWLAFAALAALAGIAATAVALGGGPVPFALLGWGLAGLVAFGLLAVFTVLDTRKRALAVYAASGLALLAYKGVVVVAGVGVLLGAWSIADWAGRL